MPSASLKLNVLPVGVLPRRPVVGRVGRPVFPYEPMVRVSLWLSVTAVAVLFGWGSWQRRWIADDGLIVLRTVRNLLAGNGPVFNQGERVEANTSTAWTYLLYVGGWVGGPMRLGTWRWPWPWCFRCWEWCCSCWGPAGCTHPACGAVGRSCFRPGRWYISRCHRPATSPPPAWRAGWCWPIWGCCGG